MFSASLTLCLWVLGTDAFATYAGAAAGPVAHCGLQRTQMCFSTIMSHILMQRARGAT